MVDIIVQVSNNNVIRVRRDVGKPEDKAASSSVVGEKRQIELLVGGKLTSTLAQWKEEQAENNNHEEKDEKVVGDGDQQRLDKEVVGADAGKEEKRREQYRRIQEFKRKKHEEKSTLKKRRLEEDKMRGTNEPFNIVKEACLDQGIMEQEKIGFESKSGESQPGRSLAKYDERTSLSAGERKHGMAKMDSGEGLHIRTDLVKPTNQKVGDISASLSLAATLAGLEDLLAENTTYVDSLPDSREEIFDRVLKDSARLSGASCPTTPLQIGVPKTPTDLLQSAIAETFTSDVIAPSIKQEKVVSLKNMASLCNGGNDYSIKQEVMDRVEDPDNIKKEPMDPVASASDLASFFSDFGVAVVKTEPEVLPEMSPNFHMEEEDGEVLFLSSNCQEKGVNLVSKCSICLLTFQDSEALSNHVSQHSRVAPIASLKSRVKASRLPILSLTRVPLPASFKRKMQPVLDPEPAAKVAKFENSFVSGLSGSSEKGEPRHILWSEMKKSGDTADSVIINRMGDSKNASRNDGTASPRLRGVEHSNMTTLQALDSLLGGGPASEPEVTCPVCGKQGYAS